MFHKSMDLSRQVLQIYGKLFQIIDRKLKNIQKDSEASIWIKIIYIYIYIYIILIIVALGIYARMEGRGEAFVLISTRLVPLLLINFIIKSILSKRIVFINGMQRHFHNS